MTSLDVGRRNAPGRALVALAAASVILGTAAVQADDTAMQRKVEERLARAKVQETAQVRVTVKNGVVTLDGVVSRMDASLRADRAAGKESKTVVNRLKVVPDVERKDLEIRKDVVDEILRYPWYTVFDSLEAGVQSGVVTLRGSVNQPYRRTDIENRVASIEGLKGLVSEIRVQGASSFDDALRRELVSAIYGDERFEPYATWAHPPIRIIVDNGRVTLTGFVGSAVEQQLVGHIARGTLAFAVDNQVKLESERAAEPPRKGPAQS